MKLVTFQGAHGPILGGVVGESVIALRPALSAAMRAAGEADRSNEVIPGHMVALLGDEAAMTAAGRALAFAARAENAALRQPLAGAKLLAPLKPTPRKFTWPATLPRTAQGLP